MVLEIVLAATRLGVERVAEEVLHRGGLRLARPRERRVLVERERERQTAERVLGLRGARRHFVPGVGDARRGERRFPVGVFGLGAVRFTLRGDILVLRRVSVAFTRLVLDRRPEDRGVRSAARGREQFPGADFGEVAETDAARGFCDEFVLGRLALACCLDCVDRFRPGRVFGPFRDFVPRLVRTFFGEERGTVDLAEPLLEEVRGTDELPGGCTCCRPVGGTRHSWC